VPTSRTTATMALAPLATVTTATGHHRRVPHTAAAVPTILGSATAGLTIGKGTAASEIEVLVTVSLLSANVRAWTAPATVGSAQGLDTRNTTAGVHVNVTTAEAKATCLVSAITNHRFRSSRTLRVTQTVRALIPGDKCPGSAGQWTARSTGL